MTVFRISRAEFADELISSGRPNRWNLTAEHVIYASSSISLCALELLAHTSGIRPTGIYKVMHIEIKNCQPTSILTDQLPTDWHRLRYYPMTQQIGSRWYEQRTSLVTRVPSAIIAQESNYIIHTQHPDFKSNVRLIKTTDFIWDHRFPES